MQVGGSNINISELHRFLDVLPRTPCTQLPDVSFCTVCVRINSGVAAGCPYSSRVEQPEIAEMTEPAHLENIPKFEQYPFIEITKTINPLLPAEYKRTIDPDAVIVEPIAAPTMDEIARARAKTAATRPMPVTKAEKPSAPQQKVIKVKKVKKSGEEVLSAPPKGKTEMPVAKELVNQDIKTVVVKPAIITKSEKPSVPQQQKVIKVKKIKKTD